MPMMSRMIEKDETAVKTANNRSIGFFLVDGIMAVKMPMGQVQYPLAHRRTFL